MNTNLNSIESNLEKILDVVLKNIPSILVGIGLLLAGSYLIRFMIRLIHKRFSARNVDPSIRAFITSILRIVLWTMLILTVASTMGIQTTSFIAALSAFGLAVGMALQGSLSNFAGGVLILVFRPFEVGDFITSNNGTSGTVERIDILYTTLIDVDGVKMFSPNGPLANSVIKNYTNITLRRFDYTIGIAYESNIKKAKDVILEILNNDPRVQSKPAPDVFVAELADSSVNLTVRGWAETKDFWSAKNSLMEKIKVELEKNNISIPYPHTEMRIINPQNDPEKSAE